MVLRDAHDNGEWNWGNWLLKANPAYRERKDAMQALGEAWGWLENRGLNTWHPDQSADKAFVVSRKGHKLLAEGLPWFRAVERLDVDLVPALERMARPQFLRGDFETAAFVAMKEVEVQVRAKASLGNDLVGVPLMQQALRPPKNDSDAGGPLFRAVLEGGESQAVMSLFAGAIGL